MPRSYPVYRCPLCHVALAWGDGHSIIPGVCTPSASSLQCEGKFEHPADGDCAHAGRTNFGHDSVDADRAGDVDGSFDSGAED